MASWPPCFRARAVNTLYFAKLTRPLWDFLYGWTLFPGGSRRERFAAVGVWIRRGYSWVLLPDVSPNVWVVHPSLSRFEVTNREIKHFPDRQAVKVGVLK